MQYLLLLFLSARVVNKSIAASIASGIFCGFLTGASAFAATNSVFPAMLKSSSARANVFPIPFPDACALPLCFRACQLLLGARRLLLGLPSVGRPFSPTTTPSPSAPLTTSVAPPSQSATPLQAFVARLRTASAAFQPSQQQMPHERR
ncbi:hypothetical protein TRVL_05389 [Trypanosoma vivax]|nr:hypothetical protein TRVL_05389 [Trypanosoma vivax]